jgi:hypothetical protein
MTMSTKAALTTPVDPTKNQLTESRRILAEMNDKADRAIDAQAAASTPMTPKK